jgi:hypothetical protein
MNFGSRLHLNGLGLRKVESGEIDFRRGDQKSADGRGGNEAPREREHTGKHKLTAEGGRYGFSKLATIDHYTVDFDHKVTRQDRVVVIADNRPVRRVMRY